MCGCGQPTAIAPKSQTDKGWAKGEPIRYIVGHGMKGKRHSDDTKRRIAAASLGKRHTEEAKAKISRRFKGWKRPGFDLRFKTSDGYVRVWIGEDHPFSEMANKKGYALEHRLKVAEDIGRPLISQEEVHHKNYDRSDNRLENLLLFPNKGSHVAHHRRLERAVLASVREGKPMAPDELYAMSALA